MSDENPAPPETLPEDVIVSLEQCTLNQLRDVIRYAQNLVVSREAGVETNVPDEDQDDSYLSHSGSTENQRETFSEKCQNGGRETSSASGHRKDDTPDDVPDGVPGKATITIKEINGNRYYYWQWRDGEKIRSKYKGPVDSDN